MDFRMSSEKKVPKGVKRDPDLKWEIPVKDFPGSALKSLRRKCPVSIGKPDSVGVWGFINNGG